MAARRARELLRSCSMTAIVPIVRPGRLLSAHSELESAVTGSGQDARAGKLQMLCSCTQTGILAATRPFRLLSARNELEWAA